MKLSKFANLVKNGGRCAVLHVAGSGIWLSTGTAIYRATELPDMEGSEQVRTVLDMTADAWKKVYLTEDWPESINNVLGLNLAPYAQGEQDTEKLKVAAAPNGLWCSACRCKVDGELIFYNEAYLAPLAEEIKKSEYIYYTARQTQTGQRYLVVHDGMDVLAAIMPMNILKEEYINDLAEFQALCMEQFYKDKERREAVIEEAEDDPEDAGQIGMMVTFDICAGNPGALQFLMQAYDMDMFKAEQGFQRMQRAGITGARLYMLWNDCCNRDTEAALLAMNTLNIESVVKFINYEGGRGIPIDIEALRAAAERM
jgi:hypothetical protein